MADIELDPNPESTWGASEEYKAAWHREHGNVSPKAGATKAEWVDFATKNGMSQDEADAATRDELVERFGAETLMGAPSAPAESIPGQGSGTGPAPSENDPAVRNAPSGTRGAARS